MKFYEEAFEATTEIVAAAMEEAEVALSAKGGEAVADFFEAIYRRLSRLEEGCEGKSGKFEVYQDAKGEWRFRLKAANGEIIAVSEGYSSLSACKKGVESVCRSSNGAEVKQV